MSHRKTLLLAAVATLLHAISAVVFPNKLTGLKLPRFLGPSVAPPPPKQPAEEAPPEDSKPFSPWSNIIRGREKLPSAAVVAARAFREIPVASAAVVALAASSPDVASALGPLVGASTMETLFQILRRAQYRYRLQNELPGPPEPAGNLSFSEFWTRVLDATEDVESFVEDWFDDDDERLSVRQLSACEIEEWIGRNTFGKPLSELPSQQRDEVATMRGDLEAKLGHSFDAERAAVKVKEERTSFIAPAAEPVTAKQHPLLLYALLEVRRSRHRAKLRAAGFARSANKNRSFACWIRAASSRKAPIVFAHGIGTGLFPYEKFIEELVARTEPERPLVLLEVPSISTTLASPTLASGEVLAADVRDVLRSEALLRGSSLRENESSSSDELPAGCVFVAHSFGSALASFLAKYEPEVLRSVVLVEPVCFLLNLAKCTKRVLYQEKSKQVWDPILDLVATDPGNAYALRRCLWWHQAMLLADDLVPCLDAPSTVFLAENDKIVPSQEVARYLDPYTQRRGSFFRGFGTRWYWDTAPGGGRRLPLTVSHFRDAGHGRWQHTPDHVHQVVDAALAGARGVDASLSSSTRSLSPANRRRALQASLARFRHAIDEAPLVIKSKVLDDLLPLLRRPSSSSSS